MQAVADSLGFNQAEALRLGYEWGTLGAATVVDIGGSSGQDASVLAAAFPDLTLVVQDLPGVESAFRTRVPTDLQAAERVTFEAHDVLQPQPCAADVYLLKWILHDWPDKYAAQILRQLVPHLEGNKKGRILLGEHVLPPGRDVQGQATLPPYLQRLMAAMDLQMLAVFNSLERTLAQWQAVAKLADPRLEARLAKTFPGTIWGLVEIVLKS